MAVLAAERRAVHRPVRRALRRGHRRGRGQLAGDLPAGDASPRHLAPPVRTGPLQEDPVTNSHNGHLDGQVVPVVDVDQVFPVLTTEAATRTGGTAPSAPGTDQTPLVASVLRTVLGWRPRTQDTQAF